MANFTVTTLTDIVDAGDGLTSLREVLVLANGDPNTADTITFSAGLVGGTASGVDDGHLTLMQGELVVAGNVTIDGDVNGDGRADITIDANDASRVINITAGDVELHSLVLTGGHVTTGGAGVFVAAGASATILDSTITGNATDGSSDARGGGIRNEGTTTLINSTVSNNYGANAGGIFNPGGTLSVINTTVSGNTSNIYVGGIYSVSGHLDITSSTVSGNFGGTSVGGGIMSLDDEGTLSNSIVAGNFGHGGVADLAAFGFTHNLAFAGVNVFSQSGIGGAGDIHEADLGKIFVAVTTVDPDGTPGNGNEFQAGLLADNGGPVQTIAITPVGVAFNAGDAGAMPADSGDLDHDANTSEPLPVDARDAPRVSGGALDVGAFEVQGGQTFVVTTLNDELDSANPNATLADFGGAGDLSLREALVLAQRDAQDTITFDASLAGHTLTLTQGELAIAGFLTIDGDVNGDGKADITIDANHASRVINITAGDVGLHSLVLTGGHVTTGGAGVFVAAGASADILDSTISGNATDGSSNARGGGIRNEGTTTLTNSTVSNNYGANAGGIFNPGGTLSLVNTTVSGNTSNIYVGGIYSVSGHLDITSSTVSGNFGGTSVGGGIMSLDDEGTLSNSIVAGNFGHGGVADLAAFGFTHNLAFAGVNVFSQSGVGGAGDIHEADLGEIFAAVTTVDPDGTPGNGNEFQAGVLADNGGPVQTVAIKAGGVAENSGDAASAVYDHDGDPSTADQAIPTDARGFARDVAGIDIGAVELQTGTDIVVTTLADEESQGGDLAAETADGGGLSLREALALANANKDSADQITFSAGLVGGSTPGMNDGHLTLTQGELVISGDVTVNGDIGGDVAPDITIDAAGNSRVLNVAAGTSTLEGLVITGGNSIYGAGVVTGGAVNLTIINSAITDNHVGGGIRNVGTLTLDGVTVSGNSSGADGGGIVNAFSGVLNAVDSTIANNTAAFNGGGLAMSGGTRTTLTNVTMSGNEAHGLHGGGAIYSGGDLTLSHATITGNHADAHGGGIYGGAGSVVIGNSIVAGNAADLDSDDVFSFTSIGYAGMNIVSIGADTDGSDHVIQAPTLADLFASVGANASTGVVSGVLANNGGPVQTVALAARAANPALDASNSPAPVTDARGVARDDLSLIAYASGSAADVGAYELQDELTITGTVAGQAITDQQTVAPFSAVTIASPDLPAQIVTVKVTLDHPGQGTFTPASLTASGFTQNGGAAGQYDFTGTAAAATTAIHQLVFAPAVNTHATMEFSIAVSDGLVSVSNSQTTVIVSDVTLPVAPSIALANDSGVSGADHITNDPTIVYGAESSATLFYKVDGAANFSATVPTFAIDGSADGVHTVVVQQRDAAGNTGPVASLTFTLDTTAPGAIAVALAHDSGISATDHITNDAALVYGAAENGGTLLYKADGAANFSTTAPTFASDGAHSVTVAQRDAAGNIGAASSLTFTLDTTAPHLTGIAASPAGGNRLTGSTIDFTLAFNEAVGVTGGPPALTLNTGKAAGYDAAATAALHDAHKLAFDYLVSSSDPRTPTLAVTGLVAHGATVADLAGNAADLTGVAATFNGLSVNDPAGTIIPAYTINGLTRPALLLDPTGHLIIDNAGAQFMADYGTKALYLGLPASTPFPPVVDTHADFHLV